MDIGRPDSFHLNLLFGPQIVSVCLHIGDTASCRHVHKLGEPSLIFIDLSLKMLDSAIRGDFDRKLVQIVLVVAYRTFSLFILKNEVVLVSDSS